MKYYNAKTIHMGFDDTITKLTDELKKEGFGVLTEIDVKETLKKKLDVEFRNYRILGACNPPFAYRALQTEDKIGALLPCNFVVQQLDKDTVEVAAVNPLVSMQSVGNPALESVASEVSEKLTRVLENM